MNEQMEFNFPEPEKKPQPVAYTDAEMHAAQQAIGLYKPLVKYDDGKWYVEQGASVIDAVELKNEQDRLYNPEEGDRADLR